MTPHAPKQKSLIVADYFIKKNKQDPRGLSNKKLQKLLYYAQAWSLVINKERLFNDPIEAWVHGPAIPAVYSTFREFGFNDIKVPVSESDLATLSEKEKGVLDEVWTVYGKYDAGYLELLTHSELPWQEARR